MNELKNCYTLLACIARLKVGSTQMNKFIYKNKGVSTEN